MKFLKSPDKERQMKQRKQTENESDPEKETIHLIEKKSKFVMKNRLLKSETEFCIDKNLQICF